MKDFTIEIDSRNGELARVAAALARARVTLRAGAVVSTGPRFVARFIASDLEAARDALESSDVPFEENDIVTVRLEPRPGELVQLISRLTLGGVDLRALYLTSTTERSLEIALAPTNVARAIHALR